MEYNVGDKVTRTGGGITWIGEIWQKADYYSEYVYSVKWYARAGLPDTILTGYTADNFDH